MHFFRNFLRKIFKTKRTRAQLPDNSQQIIQIEKNELVDYESAQEIQLTAAESNEIISFLKCLPTTIDNSKNYKVLSASPGMSLLSNGISTTLTGASLKALNPNGLFTASVAQSTLMQFGGGYGSAVLGPTGKIVQQAPFLAAEAAVFAPVLAMQVLAMITSQYYLHGINKQLDEIRKELSRLETQKYMQDAGQLDSIKDSMNEILENNFITESDLQLVRGYRKDANAIFKEYFQYLKTISEEDLHLSKHLTEKGFLKEINEQTGKTNVNYYCNIITSALKVVFMTYGVELYILAKLNKKNCYKDMKNVLLKIDSFGVNEKQKILDESNKFYNHCEGIIGEHRSKNPKTYEKEKVKELVDNFYKQKESCLSDIEGLSLSEEKKAINDIFEKKKQTLIFMDTQGRKALLQEIA